MRDRPKYINIQGNLIDLEVPKIMGILNITPDSFYKGSRYKKKHEILSAAFKMLDDGADFLDVGGYSSRPGAEDISIEEEKKRVLNAIRLISAEFPKAVISVDTFRADIARDAIYDYGAHMINDISGGDGDSEMFPLIEKLNVPYIMMHMKGNPRTMQDNPVYDDVVADILKWFGGKIVRLRSAGVKDIIIDPGFGFGKTTEQNLEILSHLEYFLKLRCPILVGLSRKSFIGNILGAPVNERLYGSLGAAAVAIYHGAHILRVHDVAEHRQLTALIDRTLVNSV